MKIGVFDSGVGGLAVANAIKKALPEHEIILREDKQHVPYANREPEEIYGFVVPIFQSLIDDGCKVIVIACNTVSTTLVNKLRVEFPDTPMVALEPMVKPAAKLTKTGKIAVCATPTTLHSERYAWLKQEYAPGIEVIEPDCSDWSYMIENNSTNTAVINSRIQEVLDQGADVIVLACTHYHWIEEDIVRMADGKATIIQPEQPAIEQLKRVLAQLA